MSNVLDHTIQQQILSLGRLGWTLSRIPQTTGVRRATISGYLKAAGIPVRGRGRPSESKSKPAISPLEVMARRRTLLGEIDLPVRVENTRASGGCLSRVLLPYADELYCHV
jgi:hypothetical protein